MSTRPPSLSKGEATRALILEQAFALSRQLGMDALSIGMLSAHLGMSKSGVFAHFGSKEELQLAVLEQAREHFTSTVVRPALSEPRGLARLRALFDCWLAHSAGSSEPGGCLWIQAASEFDDQAGPLHDAVAAAQREWRESLTKTVSLARDAGQLRAETDCRQFAFELFGLVLAAHHDARLLKDPHALGRARLGLERLIAAYAA